MKYQEAVRFSEFERLINGDLSVGDAVIIWTNFRAKPTKYNQAGGIITFCLVLTEEMAEQLRDEGWNVKENQGREEGDEPLYTTEVKVNMKSNYPPKVKLYTEFKGKKTATSLNEHSIGMLDTVAIGKVDLVVHPYEHGRDVSGGSTIKGYLKAIYVTQAKDEYFDGIYDEYEENTVSYDGIPMGDDPDDDTIPF